MHAQVCFLEATYTVCRRQILGPLALRAAAANFIAREAHLSTRSTIDRDGKMQITVRSAPRFLRLPCSHASVSTGVAKLQSVNGRPVGTNDVLGEVSMLTVGTT